jgi:hypothetical protein
LLHAISFSKTKPACLHPDVQEPSTLDATGRPLLKFPRLLRGRTATLPLVLRNQGILPVDARLELAPHEAFSLRGGSAQALHLEARQGCSHTLSFTPGKTGSFSAVASLRVKNNPFECYSLVLQGECYQVGRPAVASWHLCGLLLPATRFMLVLPSVIASLRHASQAQ